MLLVKFHKGNNNVNAKLLCCVITACKKMLWKATSILM